MLETLDYLREFHTASVFLRLTLAMILGGLIGLERGRMRRPAGFRTYLLVCLGASLTMILSQYCYHLQSTEWAELIGKAPIDISRLGAQVISGIGFLGAGTMIITRRQHVKGLTTAAGLWTSGCMGLAIGAGFYELVFLAFVLIFITMRLLNQLEVYMLKKARHLHVYIELDSLGHIGDLLTYLKEMGIQILDVDLKRGKSDIGQNSSVIFHLRMNQRQEHSQVISAISSLDCIVLIEEL